jgi:hypothetical protein
MTQLDRKNRGFYDELTDEERKRFSNYLMIRWGSTVSASQDMQEYYVQSTNYHLNRNFFAINRHPKLQWLSATAVSPGLGAFDHQYIKLRGRDDKKSANDVKKRLMNLFPAWKINDIETLASMIDARELREYERDHGAND